MTPSMIKLAKEEAQEFIRRCNEVMEEAKPDEYLGIVALRRQSMELSIVLSKLRRGE